MTDQELSRRCVEVYASGCVASLELADIAERQGDHARAVDHRASAARFSAAAFREVQA